MAGINYAGRIFGRLTAIEDTGRRDRASTVWKFRCACGVEVERAMRSVTGTTRGGGIASCGCRLADNADALALDLTGERFGRLVALRAVGRGGREDGRKWLCGCDCGEETIARVKDLRLKNTKSCGCARGHKGRKTGLRWGEPGVLEGMKFGMLTVLGLAYRRNGMRYLNCACDCGGSSIVRANLLPAGQTRSCGCLRKTGAAAYTRARTASNTASASTRAADKSNRAKASAPACEHMTRVSGAR